MRFFIALWLATTPVQAAPPTLLPHLDCGTYLIQGRLEQNSSGDFILVWNQGSYSPTEWLLVGGGFDAKNSRVGLTVTTRVRLPRAPKEHIDAPVALLDGFSDEQLPSGYRALSSEGCQ